MKYKSLEEIQQNPVWIKLQSRGTDKKELDKQFLPNEETPTGDRENECIKFV